MKNLTKKQLEKFLKKNYWEIEQSTKHFKISINTEINLNNKMKFAIGKENINLHRDPLSVDLIKQVKRAFESEKILNKEIDKKEFCKDIKKANRLIIKWQ